MKKRILPVICLALLASPVVAQENKQPAGDAPEKLENVQRVVSYGIGRQIGDNFRRQGLEGLELDALLLGIKEAMSGAESRVTDEELQKAFESFQKEISAATIKKNQEFLAANGKKEGVVTTQTGLQYKILRKGTGPNPKATDQVTVHYRGELLNGTEFDSSYKRGQPASFQLNQVIKGWTEAVQLMKVGAKWQLFVPAALAYGEQGRPGIPGNATLIFEVELLGIGAAIPNPNQK